MLALVIFFIVERNDVTLQAGALQDIDVADVGGFADKDSGPAAGNAAGDVRRQGFWDN